MTILSTIQLLYHTVLMQTLAGMGDNFFDKAAANMWL